MPDAVGVPLIVMTPPPKLAFTPEGRFVGVPIPVAPVVVWVIAVSGVLIQSVGVDEAGPAVMSGVTVMVPVALTVPQPPVRGMV